MLSKLICQEKDRVDVYQTLNHKFFASEEINEWDNETADYSLPSLNLQEFNKRALDIKTKYMITSTWSSMSPQSFLSLEPALSGFSRTYKILQNEENLDSDIDENDISMNLMNLNIATSKYKVKLIEAKT